MKTNLTERINRYSQRLGQFWCYLWSGHYFMLNIEKERLSMVCTHCGKESRGMNVERKQISMIEPKRK